MLKLVIGVLALLVPATMAISAPPAQAAVRQIDVQTSTDSGVPGSFFTVSGECGDGQSASDPWLVTITLEVDGASLRDPIITRAKADGGAFKKQVQARSTTDPDVPTVGDTIDVTVACESYLGSVASGSTTYDITRSTVRQIPVSLSQDSGPAGSVFTVTAVCGKSRGYDDGYSYSVEGWLDDDLLINRFGFMNSGEVTIRESVQAINHSLRGVPAEGDSIAITVACWTSDVVGNETLQAEGTTTYEVTRSVPCPDELPDSTGPASDGLTFDFAPDFPDATSFQGSGFDPAVPVIVCVYSTPSIVGAADPDSEGDVSIPLDFASVGDGKHTYAVIGVADDTGDPVVLTQVVDFGEPGEPVPAVGGLQQGPTQAPAAAPLPATGTPVHLRHQGLAAAVLLVLGWAFVLLTRRRGATHNGRGAGSSHS